MIFDIAPDQIEPLGSLGLVELLRRLLHAEVQHTGLSLRGVSVPLQITVADGGEDARVSWTGGAEQTNYLPSRFTILQSKATDPGPAGWKQEVWTKASRKKGVKKINPAVATAIDQLGAYVGITSSSLVGPKLDDRIKAIKDGIREAGADPSKLKEITILDANRLATWVSQYPAVAMWLNERQADPAIRTPFLSYFYPVLTDQDGVFAWDPALEKLVSEFSDVPEFLSALGRRFRPKSWSGSLVPYLEAYVLPLEKWALSQNSKLSLWARRMQRSLEKQMSAERSYDEDE